MKYEIVPGILEAAQPKLQKKFKTAAGFAHIVQIDIIDKVFAEETVIPDLTFTKKYNTEIELHLMVENPEEWIDSYQGLNVKRVAGHIENMSNPTKFLAKAREHKVDPYIALDITTPIDTSIDSVITKGCEGVLIMTVKAGKSGQKFQEKALQKAKALREKYPDLNIETDGGMSRTTIPHALKAGVNIFAATSAIFKDGDPENNYKALNKLLP